MFFEGKFGVAELIYSAIESLDGYIEDEDGTFGWAEPDEEVHTFINDLERPVGTYLYGRRLCEGAHRERQRARLLRLSLSSTSRRRTSRRWAG
jgi:hypothetical protein